MISVIIPVYNTEHWLNGCIRSVLDSSFQDFELLLIDDGSTDRSPSICKTYSQKDSRVRYIPQEHRGVSAARNEGIRQSRGQWLVFVDSDDRISPDFLGKIGQEKYQCHDLLIFDLAKRGRKGEKSGRAASSLPSAFPFRIPALPRLPGCGSALSPMLHLYIRQDIPYLVSTLLNMEQLIKGGSTSLPSPCAKAYRKSVIDEHAIRFPEDLVIGEDRLFNLQYLCCIKSCTYVPETVYFITQRPDSAMRGFYPDYLFNDFRYQRQLRGLLKKQKLLFWVKEAYYNSVLSNMADVLVRGIFNPDSPRDYEENRSLCRMMRKNRIYRQAMKHNLKTGVLPRRLLLFLLEKKQYKMVRLLCLASHRVLRRSGRL